VTVGQGWLVPIELYPALCRVGSGEHMCRYGRLFDGFRR
jgi:hypothetical protein